MITRLVRLELASLFLELTPKYRIRDRLSDVEFVEAGMSGLRIADRGLRIRQLDLVEPVIDLLDRRKEGREICIL